MLVENKISLSHLGTNVFIADMDSSDIHLPTLEAWLSCEEKTKAKGFTGEVLKSRYIISHGILRLLLSKYLLAEPVDIQYDYNEFGKPFCRNNTKLYFNMSHSNQYVCYVFSESAVVGIDLEYKKEIPELERFLSEIATPQEILALSTIKRAEKMNYVYKIWTIKEAFLKALGLGLSSSLLEIETSVLPKVCHNVLAFGNNGDLTKEWTFAPLLSIPNYIGTVSINKADQKFNFQFLKWNNFL